VCYNYVMTTSNLIALVVGGYAAIVATAALVWNILRERHNVIVRVSPAFGVGRFEGSEMVAIEIINKGHRPINIEEVGFFLSNGDKLINPMAEHNLGWLKDGDGMSYYVPKQEIEEMGKDVKKQGFRVVAAYVRDSTSTTYKGKIRKGAVWTWFNG